MKLRSTPPFWLHIMAEWDGKDDSDEQQFSMRPEVVTALKSWAATTQPRKASTRSTAKHSGGDPFEDVKAAETDLAAASETVRLALIQARIGQGPFRKKLVRLWRKCAVTGVSERAVLRASHIKPWRACSNDERLDGYNGLLLVANLDALFDAGLITFADSGALVCSNALETSEKVRLGITSRMRLSRVERQHRPYLQHHRGIVFQA